MQPTLALSLERSEIEVGAALRVDHLVAMPSAAFEALPTKKFGFWLPFMRSRHLHLELVGNFLQCLRRHIWYMLSAPSSPQLLQRHFTIFPNCASAARNR